MEIVFKRSKEQMIYNGKTIWAWNRVRNLENGLRGRTEVVFTEPFDQKEDAKPYSPQLFPVGRWQVYRPKSKPDDKYLAPFFIPTSATRIVPTWKVNSGHYIEQSGTQLDSDYGIHFSTSSTTLGCIRIGQESDLLDLVNAIRTVLDKGDSVWISVEE